MARKIFLLLVISMTLSGCRDFREINFFVINTTSQEISVKYRVRSCLGVNTNCFPQTFNTNIAAGDEVRLNLQDHSTTDYEIEESFFEFEITRGSTKSTYKFWGTDKLKTEIFEEHIDHRLYVDEDFF
ncbi:MAG: hypothetical protein JJU02_06260 [Cryomorphaceae bacterium]|nr:hypothetical protein [Cryomorphaceae bacterium]